VQCTLTHAGMQACVLCNNMIAINCVHTGEMAPVNAWRPYGSSQQSPAMTRAQHLSSRDLLPLLGGVPPASTHEERIPMEPGKSSS
jgi:hypothetical protein